MQTFQAFDANYAIVTVAIGDYGSGSCQFGTVYRQNTGDSLN